MYERPPARHSFFPTVYTRDASSKAERGGVNIGVTEALRGAFTEALRGAFTERSAAPSKRSAAPAAPSDASAFSSSS